MANCPNCGTPVAVDKDSLPAEYKPLGAWAYFGYNLLFAIPVVGFILLIVFACGGCQNRNLRSYARSFFCSLLLTAILFVVLFIVLGGVAGVTSIVESLF